MDCSEAICAIADFIYPWNLEIENDYIDVIVVLLVIISVVILFAFIKKLTHSTQSEILKINEVLSLYCSPLCFMCMSLLIIWYIGIPILSLLFFAWYYQAKKDEEIDLSVKQTVVRGFANIFLPYIIMFILALFGMPYRII